MPDAPDVGFEDADLKLNYDVAPRQNVNLFASDGHTSMHDSSVTDVNGFASGKSDFMLARVGWRWAATPKLLVDARAAFFREPYSLRNPEHQPVSNNDYREWIGGGNITWNWARSQLLEAGWTIRHIGESQTIFTYSNNGSRDSGAQYGAEIRQSGFVQQATTLWKGRLHVLGGLRWDTLQQLDFHPFSPQISAALQATSSTTFELAAGRYQQFPALEEYANVCFTPSTMPEQSDHFTGAVEQRWGENIRLRVQVFDRQDSFALAAIPGLQFSQAGSCPRAAEPVAHSTVQQGYSRGVQVVVQRRSANRLSGWLGYTWAHAQQKQFNNPFFPCPPYCLAAPYSPSLDDQRNGLNVFSMYRLKPSVNLSGKFLFGSGFPVSTGVFVQVGTTYQPVGSETVRLPYQRLDLRVDKDWAFARWKLTLYGEVLNVTNHYNSRYVYSSVIDPNTGLAQVKTEQGLPVTPTVGVVFQF